MKLSKAFWSGMVLAVLHGILMIMVWVKHVDSGKSVYFNSWKDIIYVIYAPGFVLGRPLAILYDSGLFSEQSILWAMFALNLVFSFFVGFFIFKLFKKPNPLIAKH